MRLALAAFVIAVFSVFMGARSAPAQTANLAVTNTDSPDPVIAGNNLTYTITVTNGGPNAASNVALTDAVPANTTFVSLMQTSGPAFTLTTPPVGGTGTVSATTATLAAGASATFTLVVHVNSSTPNGTTITNTATVSSTTTDPTPANNTATATTTVTTRADLSVTKSDAPDPVVAGTNLRYTMTVANGGPSDAQNVSLADTIPANTTFVSLLQNSGPAFTLTTPPVGGTGTASATTTTLAAGASATFTLVVNTNSAVQNGSTISNTASVTSTTTDPTPANNSQTATTTAKVSTLYALTAGNSLLQFDSGSPFTIARTVQITGLQSATERIIGIDFRPRTGQLYALTVPVGIVANALVRTYVVNPLTGAATFVGSIPNTVPGAADTPSGLDFNPTVDRIRIVNVNDENFRVNPNSGALAGDDTNLNPAGSQIVAEAYDRNWDRANATTIPTTLYGISRATSALVTQGGINGAAAGGANGGPIATVGALGVALTAGSDAGFDIDAGGTAYAALTVGGNTQLYTVNLATGAATLLGSIGNGATPVTGLAVVPRSLVIVGAGPGGGPHVRVFDGATGLQIPGPLGSFFAYDPAFTGGVRVALGDINGDGALDVITTAGPGGGPHVRVLNGRTGLPIAGPLGSFNAFAPAFTGGVNVAAGDVNGDGFQDVIVAADAGGGPHVRVFSGRDGTELLSFFAYDPGFLGGVRVAAADFDLNGRAEIITAPGPGGGPHVRIFDNTGNPFASPSLPNFVNSFFAYDVSLTLGVFVAAGDVNGDGTPDIVTGAGAGGGPHAKAFSGTDGSLIASFFAYDPTFSGGVRVGVGDVNGDSVADLITAPGPGGGPHVRAFDGDTGLPIAGPLGSFFPYPPAFGGGVYVGGGRR